MDLAEKLKGYILALLVGFFNPYPVKAAGAVAVLAVLANLTGMFAAVRRGEKVSGYKTLRGNLRIVIYFISFAALYHALYDNVLTQHLLSAIYSAIALHEFMLLVQKAHEAGIIPRGLLKKLQNLRKENSDAGAV